MTAGLEKYLVRFGVQPYLLKSSRYSPSDWKGSQIMAITRKKPVSTFNTTCRLFLRPQSWSLVGGLEFHNPLFFLFYCFFRAQIPFGFNILSSKFHPKRDMLDPYTLQKGSATKQNSLLILSISSSKHLMLEYDLKLKKKKQKTPSPLWQWGCKEHLTERTTSCHNMIDY